MQAVSAPTRSAFGGLLRQWRGTRGLSQLALALRVQTTTRHLSYLENGRSRPGRELVLRLSSALDLPLRGRNELLVAAGLPAEFPARQLRSAALAPYRGAVMQLLGAIDPVPAFVLDPTFDVLEANAVGQRLVPALATGERVNLVDAFLAPGPARASIANFPEVAWSWHLRILRAAAASPSAQLEDLLARVEAYLRDVPHPLQDATGEPVVCPTFRIGDATVRTIGMTMRFGPSRDVTLEELFVDVLCPRDDVARRFFETLAAAPAVGGPTV